MFLGVLISLVLGVPMCSTFAFAQIPTTLLVLSYFHKLFSFYCTSHLLAGLFQNCLNDIILRVRYVLGGSRESAGAAVIALVRYQILCTLASTSMAGGRFNDNWGFGCNNPNNLNTVSATSYSTRATFTFPNIF